MEHRGKQVSSWTKGELVVTVTSDGQVIRGSVTKGGKVLYERGDFITWNGAVNAVSAEADRLS